MKTLEVKRRVPGPPGWVLNYMASLSFVGVALLLTHLFWPILDRQTSSFFLAAVMLSAFFCGMGPALLSTALSVLLVDYYIIEPFYQVEFTAASFIRLVLFGSVGLLVSWLSEARRTLMINLQERDREREELLKKISRFNVELTEEVKHKTQELTSAHNELMRSQQRLLRSERMEIVGQLAGSLAHEIGTPLNAIAGHLQLLGRNHPSDADTQRRVQIINKQLDFIVSIVRNLLDRVSRRHPKFTYLDLNSVLRDIWGLVGPMLDQRGVKYRLLLDDDLPGIMADSEMLQQVFVNLINNSLDAMPAGGEIDLITRFDEELGLAELIISDSGPGINAADAENIFEPLWTGRSEGTGFGLAIVREIIREHNGNIEPILSGDSGASFRITIPVSTTKVSHPQTEIAAHAG